MPFASKKLKPGKSPIHGTGIFARQAILKNELLLDYAGTPGEICSEVEADKRMKNGAKRTMQVGENLFFVAEKKSENDLQFRINHSCCPNTGMRGNWKVVAMRDISAGEEITHDYAMTESSRDLALECNCACAQCRGRVSGNDWKIPELQKRYLGYFSEYIRKKIHGNG